MGSHKIVTKLSQEIQDAYDRLVGLVSNLSEEERTRASIDGTGGKISAADLVAYQIGWGQCLIQWYEAGIRGEKPVMPGDGFSTWDYTNIAKHFYKKYGFDSSVLQMQRFHQVVFRILEIVQKEDLAGNLDRLGIWPWCTLASGKPRKQWPLSKWVRVNTVAPYKRALSLLKK